MKSIKELIDNPLAATGRKAPPAGSAKRPPAKPRQTVERTDVALPDRNISMSNALARGVQGLNLSQKRLLALAMAKIDSMSERDAQHSSGGWQVRLTASEYSDVFEVDPNTAYTQLKTGTASLLRTLWTAVTAASKGKEEVVTQGQWLFLAEYRKKSGCVDIVFHPKVAPHLLSLRSQFTTYKLKQAAALRSIYAWRLFECLLSWKAKGEWRVSIPDFITTMDAPRSCAANFKDLRRRVIEPAVKELVEKDGMQIEVILAKEGKKTVGLTFKFRKDPQGRLDLS